METFIKEVVKELQKQSNTKLSEKDKKKMYNNFPIPKDHEILLFDNIDNNKKCGIIITNIGVFFYNRKDKKDKNNCIYHYFKWEYFNLEDFKLKKNLENKYDVIFNGKKILEINQTTNFFKSYTNTYNKFIKEAIVSSENIFIDLETVIPENFAKVNSKHGHGEMAEEVLTLLDKLQGKNAEVIGRNNKKNIDDRIVNGI